MKARLIQQGDVLMLLLCTGSVKRLSGTEAYNFITNFDDRKYYSGKGKWDNKTMPMEEFPGETIAVVNDDGVLCIESSALLRNAFSQKSSNYLSVSEYAELYGKQAAIIRRFCSEGRLPGAVHKGRAWLIPDDCPYPADERSRK